MTEIHEGSAYKSRGWRFGISPCLRGFVSAFLPQSADMQIRLIGDSKLPIGVNVGLNDCLSLYVGLVMNWRHVQGECCPRPVSAGIGFSPLDPAIDKRLHIMNK